MLTEHRPFPVGQYIGIWKGGEPAFSKGDSSQQQVWRRRELYLLREDVDKYQTKVKQRILKLQTQDREGHQCGGRVGERGKSFGLQVTLVSGTGQQQSQLQIPSGGERRQLTCSCFDQSGQSCLAWEAGGESSSLNYTSLDGRASGG